MKVLIIDNYDSFVYNLAQYAGEIADDVIVKRNDSLNIGGIAKLSPDRIIISPGPGNPTNPKYLGICNKLLRGVSIHTPTLGVCLGHQGIVTSFGGTVRRARRVRHGKISPIVHDGKGIFSGLDSPFDAARYHSLVADPRTLPDCLEISAHSGDDSEVMGIRHREFPIEGVQFHPESILTKSGHRLMANFLSQG